MSVHRNKNPIESKIRIQKVEKVMKNHEKMENCLRICVDIEKSNRLNKKRNSINEKNQADARQNTSYGTATKSNPI